MSGLGIGGLWLPIWTDGLFCTQGTDRHWAAVVPGPTALSRWFICVTDSATLLSDSASYVPPVEVGAVMRAGAIGAPHGVAASRLCRRRLRLRCFRRPGIRRVRRRGRHEARHFTAEQIMTEAAAQEPYLPLPPAPATVADVMRPPATTVEQNDHAAGARR